MSRPLPYKFSNDSVTLGHYQVAQISGALAATIGALTPTTGANALAAIRYVPTTSIGAKLVLTRLRVGITVTTAVTTAVETSVAAVIGRAFTVTYTGGSPTQASMVAGNGKMDPDMQDSLMAATGPLIAGTAVMSGQTFGGDANVFAAVTFPNPSPTLGAAAVTNQVGCATDMRDLYNWQTMGGHPPTLSSGMGIAVGLLQAGPASGTWKLAVEWSWAEVIKPFGY